MATDDWCDDADDWGDDGGDDDAWSTPAGATQTDPESTELSERLMGIDINNSSNHGDDKIEDICQQLQKVYSDVPRFQPYFVNVFDEPEAEELFLTAHEKKLMAEYQQREGVNFQEWQETGGATGKSGGGGGKESYEKASIKHGDKYFHRFSKKLALCPEQCVR